MYMAFLPLFAVNGKQEKGDIRQK